MQAPHFSSSSTLSTESPTAALGKHLRWQVALACAGIFALTILLGYSTYSVATVLVPDQGGVFREGVAGNPRYLNPLYCEDNSPVDEDLCALLYRGLTKKDKNGRVVADLALDWTITDGKIYTFRLRTDQFWHDGRPVTIDDVLFTFGIFQDPNVQNKPDLTRLWRSVKMEKLSEDTVRFTLSEPLSSFLDTTVLGLLPKHIYANTPAEELANSPLNGTPIGTGPLMVTQMAADHIRLEPSPYYNGPKPYLSALELRFYPDHPSLFTAFVNGEIDGISRILPSDLPAVVKRDDLRPMSAVESKYLELIFNLENPNAPFFKDTSVRQALSYALDRKGIIDRAVAGQGIPADSIMLPESWAYNPNTPDYAYSVERANQLLDQAGWVDSNGDGVRDKNGAPLQFLLHTNDDSTHADVIRQVALDWEKIGVRAVPTPVNLGILLGDILTPRSFDMALIELEVTGDPDPYSLWHSTQAEGGGYNFGGWRNQEADQIMEQARAIVDEAERQKLYWRFQEIFAEELPALPLYYPVYTYAVSTRVQNVQIPSLRQPSERFANFADWYIVTRRVPANQVPTDAPPTPPGQ